MTAVIKIWRDSLHKVLDIYERKRGSIAVFFPLLFLFFLTTSFFCPPQATTVRLEAPTSSAIAPACPLSPACLLSLYSRHAHCQPLREIQLASFVLLLIGVSDD